MIEPGTRIAIQRRMKGVPQKDLAVRAGITQANLSNIEKGKRDLTVSTLLRIAAALDLRPCVLLEEETPAEKIELTRSRIEALAEAVLDPAFKKKPELKALAAEIRTILPGSRSSTKQIELAWAGLRQKFSAVEIKAILQRVEDARQRARA